ncbi:hypothetical protein CXB51_027213 [Gossypium anomalum]|uniref:MULE transposase domain-containing protein n=1 Tax=Gossypium anomalum TaxID=47600 RepID=A0A8J5YI27_9ROSI|nr:hypothetical protein CXB51_027213 [Gossypium anomalum]
MDKLIRVGGVTFDVEQNTLGGDFGGEVSDSDDSSYKAYESDTAYFDSFESNSDRVDEPEIELVGEMIQKELDHLLGSGFWSLEDDFDSNSDEDLTNDVDYDKYGNKKRIIGLDRCWLKGYYGRHLLAVVGVDANDCIYLVAFAAVESENKQSWFWFLELLQRDFDIENSYNICFMSNKQKGLIEAVFLFFPNAEARNCARHLYNNFKNMEGFRGQVMRFTYWKAAKATFLRQFEEEMSEMRSLSESAEAWLCDKDPRTWSKAHFSTRCKSNLLLNSNKLFKDLLSLQIILEARDKPILTMLEIIRRKVMTRLVSMREAAEKYPRPLCPRIQKKLSKIVSQSNNIWLVYAGNEKYEVDCGLGNKHVVDLLNSSCLYRKWDLSEIPCPMQWEHVKDMEPIFPPIIRRPPGRPKQTRRKEVDEARKKGPKLSKAGQ